MSLTLRNHSPADFEALYEIDQSCYPRGIAYSRRTLRWFLGLKNADCVVAETEERGEQRIAGFIITESAKASGHIITLDVAESFRRAGAGTALLSDAERRMGRRGVEFVILETAVTNEAAVAFWKRSGYQIIGKIPRYYLGRVDAFEMAKRIVTSS